jgi:hypothetical protein
MYKLVVLACSLSMAAAVADPTVAYAAGLPYGHAYQGFAGAYAHAAPVAYAHAAAPVAYAHAAVAPVAVAPAPYRGVPVAHSLGLPEAATYALPPTRQVAEAPIVEQVVEPVEQWGYKVAY